MKVELQPCFILHQRPWRETSLMLEVFSLGFGRVSLVARGAKRGRHSQAQLLQPARRLQISWSQRAEMGTLSGVEASGPYTALLGRRLFCCFYLNELLLRMLHRHESHPELFRQYELTLDQLRNSAEEDRVLRIFEKHLLRTLGYGLILDQDAQTGEPVDPSGQYYYVTGSGPQSEVPSSPAHIRISGRTLQALEREQAWDVEIAREAKRLMRALLDEHTGERPLQSRALYRAYLQQTDDRRG